MNTMSPNCSPSALPKGTGLRTVNKLPIYLMGLVILAFMLIMMLTMKDRADAQNRKEQEETPTAASATQFAQEVVGTRTGGLITPPDNTPKDDAAAKKNKPDFRPRSEDSNKPAAAAPAAPPPIDEELLRIRQAKAQMFAEAVKSRTTVRGAAARSPGSAAPPPTTAANNMQERLEEVRRMMAANQSNDPTAAYKARLEQLRAAGLAGGAPAPAAGGQQASGAPADRWELDLQVQTPRSPFELRAGSVIPATLISGINSDLPGQIVGQVSQDVYDTATGHHLLIPQGSRLVGTYNSGVAYGQERVLVAWTRIVFPDGKALDLGSMPGADSAGYGGFEDQVDNHYLRLFGSALLMSAVTAGITYSQRQSDSGDSDRTDASSVLSEALGQQLGQATAQLLSKNLSIAPTLQIRPGYRFNVVVTKDLTFSKPYQSFDY